MWTIAAGPEGQLVSGELTSVATTPSYTIAGGITALIQKQVFTSITNALTKGKSFTIYIQTISP